MKPDYKQQMWLMTDGLGEWMTRQEMRRRRRRRVALVIGALVIVTLAVLGVVMLLFPRTVIHQHQHNNVYNYYGTEMPANVFQGDTNAPGNSLNGQHTTISNSYTPEMLDKIEGMVRGKGGSAAETKNADSKGIVVKGGEGETVHIGKDGIRVKDKDGEEVNISLDLDGLIKKYGK